jgi:nucleoside-diphosphate-sugar epimerase
MKSFVTGAAGFIGSHLVELLCEKGHDVVGLVRAGEDTRWLDGQPIKVVRGDVTDRASLSSAMKDRFDFVFHLAGVLKTDDLGSYRTVNVEGTRNLLDAILESRLKLRRFVFVSSGAAAGPSGGGRTIDETEPCRPVNDYGRSKAEAERVIGGNDGPRNQHGLYSYFYCASRGLRPVLGEGTASLIHVKDLARAILLAAEHEKSAGKTYFVGGTKLYSYEELGAIISRSVGRKTIRVKVPVSMLLVMGTLLQTVAKMTRTRPVFDLRRARDLSHRYWGFDTSKIQRELGFVPEFSLEEGAKETAEWYRKEGWIR